MAEEGTKTPSGTVPTATRVLDQGKRQFIMKDIGGYGKKVFEPREPVCLYETR